jgi:hypothetical protein
MDSDSKFETINSSFNNSKVLYDFISCDEYFTFINGF